MAINRQTKLCRRRTEWPHLEEERTFREQLGRQHTEATGAADIDELHRKRDRIRQRNNRTCRGTG